MKPDVQQPDSGEKLNMAAITAAFARLSVPDNLATCAWPQSYRNSAFSSLTQTGFPSKNEEDWKYTSLDSFIQRSVEYLPNDTADLADERVVRLLAELPVIEDEIRIVFINGRYNSELSAELSGNDTLTLAPYSVGTADSIELNHPELIANNPLIALNSAFLTDGLKISVAAEQQIKTPIHVIFIADGQPSAGQARLTIDLGPDASALVLQHHVGYGQGLTNGVTSISCGENSHLTYLKLQNESSESIYVCNLLATVAENARFEYIGLDFGSLLARSDLNIELNGANANANLHGLFMANNSRHVDNHLRIDHKCIDTRSEENFRGILNDEARGVFNGKIVVHSGADGTDARMSNRNLLLGERAEIDTKPELEIYTDDVKCAHGSTTGRLDQNSLFYLRARGIPERMARSMLVAAFAREIIDQACSNLPTMANYLEGLIFAQLPDNP